VLSFYISELFSQLEKTKYLKLNKLRARIMAIELLYYKVQLIKRATK